MNTPAVAQPIETVAEQIRFLGKPANKDNMERGRQTSSIRAPISWEARQTRSSRAICKS